MIRLIATDVDGTLFDSSRRVTERNRDALRRAAESGIVVCLASGRLVPTLLPVVEAVGVTGPIIACNGAYAESAEREPLFHAELGIGAVEAVLDYSQAHQVAANVYQPYTVLASHESEMLELYRTRTKLGPEVLGWDRLKQAAVTKIIFIDHPERNVRHAEHFRPLASQLGYHMTVSEPEYLEFLPEGVSKRTALQAVARHLGLAREEVAAIGDYHNDFEMVTWAGLGGAMGSGAPELQAAADLVVPGNDDDGLAVFVEHVLALNGA